MRRQGLCYISFESYDFKKIKINSRLGRNSGTLERFEIIKVNFLPSDSLDNRSGTWMYADYGFIDDNKALFRKQATTIG